MEAACKLFGHKWNGRICKRCGAIRSVAHAHHFVPMKGECAEQCTICGEQRATEHDWHSPPEGKSSDGRYVVIIGGKDICRKCGAEQYARVRLGYAECDASELTPLQRDILRKACKQLAKNNQNSDKKMKDELQSIAFNMEYKRLYFYQHMLDTVKLAEALYLNEQAGRLKETTASEEQDALLLEYLAGTELMEKLNHIKTNE
ncbi:MAG: hypothetical protein LLF75_06110 [Eubacteriales bacterium]|nr:hypothetical protein [Eubacteriales bacterium]